MFTHKIVNSIFIKFVFCFFIGPKKILSVALSKMNFENLSRELLLVRSYRVELYRSKGKNVNWELVARASPGNLQQFEEVLFKNNVMSESSIVLSLKLMSSETGEQVFLYSFKVFFNIKVFTVKHLYDKIKLQTTY